MRTTDTAGSSRDRSGAVSQLNIRPGDVENLTPARRSAHHSPVTEKDVTGIGVLLYAAMSRSVFRSAAFLRLVAPSMGGPGGRAARLAGAYPVRQSRSVPPTPIGVVVRGSLNELEYASMSNTQPTSASSRATARHPFVRANANGDLLFEVRAGVPAINALELASCYMASARDLAGDCASAAEGENPDHLWGAFYLIEMAKAVLDSAISALHDEERSHE